MLTSRLIPLSTRVCHSSSTMVEPVLSSTLTSALSVSSLTRKLTEESSQRESTSPFLMLSHPLVNPKSFPARLKMKPTRRLSVKERLKRKSLSVKILNQRRVTSSKSKLLQKPSNHYHMLI